MQHLPVKKRTLGLLAVILPLLALFIYVGLRSGPLGPVAVTVATVESRAVAPALFGIDPVEARKVARAALQASAAQLMSFADAVALARGDLVTLKALTNCSVIMLQAQ